MTVSLEEIVSMVLIRVFIIPSWFRVVVLFPFIVVRSVIVLRLILMMFIRVAVMACHSIETPQIVIVANMVI